MSEGHKGQWAQQGQIEPLPGTELEFTKWEPARLGSALNEQLEPLDLIELLARQQTIKAALERRR